MVAPCRRRPRGDPRLNLCLGSLVLVALDFSEPGWGVTAFGKIVRL